MRSLITVCAPLVCLLAGTSGAQSLNDHLYILHPEGVDRLGVALAPAGDVDADGVPDFIGGADGAEYAAVYSGLDARRILVLRDPNLGQSNTGFGGSVAGIGDLDGDGHADLLVGAHNDDSFGLSVGAAYIYSGRNGRLLRKLVGDAAFDHFGWDVAGISDLNGDGVDDFMVSAVAPISPIMPDRYVRVFSGRTGDELYTLRGSATDPDQFGYSIAAMDDITGDGVAEILVGSPLYSSAGPQGRQCGRAQVFSGSTGSLHDEQFGDFEFDFFGTDVADVGDVNGDSIPDWIAGAPGDDSFGDSSGLARVHSGLQGATVIEYHGWIPFERMGTALSAAGDVDEDGFADVLIGLPFDSQLGLERGSAWVYSGRHGATLREWHGRTEQDRLGWSVAMLGDINSDGVTDFGVGVPNSDPFFGGVGGIYPFSGEALALSTDIHQISITLGGQQQLQLDAGLALAGMEYRLLGSASGMSPALTLGGHELPLNARDKYFRHSLKHPNQAPLSNSWGTLDAAGRASAVFTVDAQFPRALAGRTLHHAFLVQDPQTGAVLFTSHASTLALLP